MRHTISLTAVASTRKCHAESHHNECLLIQIQFALVEFEGINTAGINDFNPNGFGRLHRPRNIIINRFLVFFSRQQSQ